MQPGSRLLGTTFPGGTSDQTGKPVTEAFVAVTGALPTVFAAYARDLHRAGYAVGQSSCGPTDVKGVGCDVVGKRSDGTQIAVSVRTPAAGSRAFATVARLQMQVPSRRASAPADGPTTTQDAAARYLSALAAQPPPPSTRSPQDVATEANVVTVADVPVPSVGELLAPAAMDVDRALRVVRGSAPLSTAAPFHVGCLGWSTVVRVGGDPVAVRNAYLRQFRGDPGSRSGDTSPRRVGGRRLLLGSSSIAGGSIVSTRSTTDAQGHWFMLIGVDHDC